MELVQILLERLKMGIGSAVVRELTLLGTDLLHIHVEFPFDYNVDATYHVTEAHEGANKLIKLFLDFFHGAAVSSRVVSEE